MKTIRPEKKSLYGVFNPNGIRWIFQLRVGLSHKKLHNFKDTPDDTCLCNTGAETAQHFLLNCPIFRNQCHVLFQTINPILLANNLQHLPDSALVKFLLYGHDKLKPHVNQSILRTVMIFIGNTHRFSQNSDE